MELEFDLLAPRWETIRAEHSLAPLVAALETVQAPRRALDLGAGTGAGAFAIAERFPDAEVVGVDLSGEMVAEARRNLPDTLHGRVQFEQADASCLPFEDGAFDLVVLLNMIPFFDEVARVIGPGGHAVFVFVHGAATPIYVPPERLRAGLEHGFSDVAELAAGAGTALVARRR